MYMGNGNEYDPIHASADRDASMGSYSLPFPVYV